jgi:hypothetical protein
MTKHISFLHETLQAFRRHKHLLCNFFLRFFEFLKIFLMILLFGGQKALSNPNRGFSNYSIPPLFLLKLLPDTSSHPDPDSRMSVCSVCLFNYETHRFYSDETKAPAVSDRKVQLFLGCIHFLAVEFVGLCPTNI